MPEKPKNTAPSPPQEYQVVQLPPRSKVGSNPTGAAIGSEQAVTTSGPSKAAKEGAK